MELPHRQIRQDPQQPGVPAQHEFPLKPEEYGSTVPQPTNNKSAASGLRFCFASLENLLHCRCQMRLLILLALLLAPVVHAQSCPKENPNGPSTEFTSLTLTGKLIYHNEIRQWFELRLAKPVCGQTSIQLFSEKPFATTEGQIPSTSPSKPSDAATSPRAARSTFPAPATSPPSSTNPSPPSKRSPDASISVHCPTTPN